MMGASITRWCQEHGEWDDDVDNLEEGCPDCIEEGKFKTRGQLLNENAALRQKLIEWAREAHEDVDKWGKWTGDYFQDRRWLDADLAKWKERAKEE